MAQIFVDAAFIGSEDGTAASPWNTITEALIEASFFPTSEMVSIFVKDGTYVENLTLTRGKLEQIFIKI